MSVLTKLRRWIKQTLDFSLCTEINQKTDLFINRIDETYNKYCPIRSKTITKCTSEILGQPKLNPSILNSSNKAELVKKTMIPTRTN